MIRTCIGFFLLTCLIGHAAVGQDNTVSESFTVSVATVEVVVTNKDGLRVGGLPRDAFSLEVDGVARDLSFFNEVRSDKTSGYVTADQANDLPGEVQQEDAVPRNYLLYIDDWFTMRPYRARLFKHLLHNVDALRDIDRMAVVRYKGKGLEMLTTWTSDRDELREIINQVADSVPGDLTRKARFQSGQGDPVGRRNIAVPGVGDELGHSLDAAATRQFQQIHTTVASVEVAMRSMPLPDGRRNLLLVTGGWPYLFRAAGNVNERLPNTPRGGEWMLRPVTDTANLLGYTVYPMLLGKIEAGHFTDRESPTFAGFSQDTAFEVAHDGMSFIAETTGGSLVSKAQFAELPLSRVADDQGHYYRLGFSTEGLAPGVRHDIRVVSHSDAYQIRHRRDFRIRTKEESADILAQAAVFTGNTPDNLAVALGAPEKKRGKLLVPFTLTIPMDWMALEPAGEQVRSRLTLRVTAEDSGGYQADVVRAPIVMSGNQPQPGDTTLYEAALMVRKKKQRLVFTLQDDVGGETLATTVAFTP